MCHQGELSYYAVYDGHGGVEAAKYASVQLHSVLGRKLRSQQPKEALFAAFQETDRMFVDRASREVRGLASFFNLLPAGCFLCYHLICVQ